jgi:peptidoglycan/LPS O-acetylase OafA/YrhL
MDDRVKYQPHIDGLRTLAVLVVMFYHMGLSTFGGGYVGVDVFFVISGFLITRIIKLEIESTGTFSFPRFYLRRARRLGPALISVSLVTTIIATATFSAPQIQRFGGSLYATLLSFSNIYFWIEDDYFDVASKLKPLLHTWSLSIEEQFYILWPALVLFLYRVGARRLVVPALLFSGIVSLLLNILVGGGDVVWPTTAFPSLGALLANGKGTIFFLLPFRVFEFAIGAALVWAPRHRPSLRVVHDAAFLLGLALIVASVLLYGEDLLFPSFYALAPCLGAALVIHAGERASMAWILRNRAMVAIGLVSYSLYLVHWPIIVFWTYMAGPMGHGDIALATLLCFATAFANHRYVEHKFRFPRTAGTNRGFVLGCAAVVSACVAVGASMKLSDGWTWRIPDSAYKTLATAPDPVAENRDAFHRRYYGGAGYDPYPPLDPAHPPAVIVMGDSHGAHYAHGVHELLTSPGHDMYLAAGTSCFHLPGFTRRTKGMDWDDRCPKALAKGLAAIHAAHRPLVILSHSWRSQMTRGAKLLPTGERSADPVTVDDLIAGLSRFKALAGDVNLVVIGNVPGTGKLDITDLYTRPEWLAESTEKYKWSKAAPKTMAFNARLRDAARTTGDFLFIDPFDILCANGQCANFDDDGRPIYSDTTHLSRFGSMKIIGAIKDQLLPLIPQ